MPVAQLTPSLGPKDSITEGANIEAMGPLGFGVTFGAVWLNPGERGIGAGLFRFHTWECTVRLLVCQTDAMISRFPVPELDDLPEDIRERIVAVAEKSGFVPNIFMALARRPAEFRAFFAYHDALMESNEGLSKAERELVVVATSATNDCLYCVVAHGAILRIRAKDALIADQVAVNPAKADLSDRERHIVDFALKVATDSAAVSDADLEAMRQAGFSNDEIWDIGAITAMFAMSNRLANFISVPPNDEFYSMAR